MAQDMARSRSYAQEIATLNDRVGLKERIIVQQDTIIEAYKGKLKTYMKLYDSCNDANSAYEADIANLKRDVRIQKAQKKFWKYTAIVVPIVVGGFVHLHWKFGH
jgi:division protein CdvB (Snf7/Vps24/ESCRT-III family)